MVFFNYALRKLNAKIVYYGPGLCGKTTNLQWIHDHFEGGKKGNMLSLATEGDRTIFFDLLPLDIGTIRGMDVTLQLYTVPGQVHYNSTRQLVLRGADGVVFVADSQRAMLGSNLDSWKNLKENLLLQGVELQSFPHVLQFNKRDLGDILSVEQLDEELNEYSAPIFEAVAIEGIGVQETLEGIVKLVMRSLRERYEAEFARPGAPARFAGTSAAPSAPVPPAQPPAWPVPQPAVAAAPPPEPEREAFTAPVDYGEGPEAETHPGVAGLSLSSNEEEEKEPTLVIAPEDTGLPVPEVGDVELDEAALETADLVEEPSPLDLELSESEVPSLDLSAEDEAGASGSPESSAAARVEREPEEEISPREAGAEETAVEYHPEFEAAGGIAEAEGGQLPVENPAGVASEAGEPIPPSELQGEVEQPAAGPLWEPAGEGGNAEGFAAAETAEAGGEAGVTEPFPAEDAERPLESGTSRSEEILALDTGPHAPAAARGEFQEEGAAAQEPAGEPDVESEPGAPPIPEEPPSPEEPAVASAEAAATAVDPFELPSDEVGSAPQLDEELFTVDEEPVEAAGPEAEEPPPAASEAERGQTAPHSPEEPVAVWDGDPFQLPEDGGSAPETRVLAPVEARAVTGAGGGNQLRLSLEGTGALAEYGQVRELDIVVPVPGDWIGGQKVTLQFRLTLVPEGEAE